VPAAGRPVSPAADRPGTAERIERILRESFRPVHLELRDDSARHAGHPGATSGGHFKLRLVSARFEGLTRLEQHRQVYEALGSMMGREIHALALDTRSPSEWPLEG
jgi:BolA protein